MLITTTIADSTLHVADQQIELTTDAESIKISEASAKELAAANPAVADAGLEAVFHSLEEGDTAEGLTRTLDLLGRLVECARSYAELPEIWDARLCGYRALTDEERARASVTAGLGVRLRPITF